MDNIDRTIINTLQRGFPVVAEPFAVVAKDLGIDQIELIQRIQALLDGKILTRFGPMYHAERLGGGVTLAAMAIPWEEFEEIADQVNAFPQVAHNYARDHTLNMWFVLATESPEEIGATIQRIEEITGYRVYNLPKRKEFFLGLHFSA